MAANALLCYGEHIVIGPTGSYEAISIIRYDGMACVGVARLLIEIIRHRDEDHADAVVELAARKLTAMLGLAPKLLWKGFHIPTTHLG